MNMNSKNLTIDLGRDIDDLINDYLWELNYTDRVENHQLLFNKCLKELINLKFLRLYDDLLLDLDWNNNDVSSIDVILNDTEITIDNNMNDWNGYCGNDLLDNILINYKNYYDFETFEDFRDEIIKKNRKRMKKRIIDNLFENMLGMNRFITDILDDLYLDELECKNFREWIGENC